MVFLYKSKSFTYETKLKFLEILNFYINNLYFSGTF